MTRVVDITLVVGLVLAATIGGHSTYAEEARALLDRVADAPVGQLRSPYGDSTAIAEEKKSYIAHLIVPDATAAAAWRLRSRMRFGFTAATTTHCSV
jgi:hypothetical protein